jgi:hypothetical protein
MSGLPRPGVQPERKSASQIIESAYRLGEECTVSIDEIGMDSLPTSGGGTRYSNRYVATLVGITYRHVVLRLGDGTTLAINWDRIVGLWQDGGNRG